MLFFIRSYIPDFDGKLKKYIKALNSQNIDYQFIGWDRAGNSKIDPKNILFKKKGYIGGGIKNIFNLVLWNIFIFIILFQNRKKVNIVHAIDFDSALVALIFCKIFSKKIIFDVYDKYSDTHNISGIFKKIIDKTETSLIENSDICILADEFRKQQHQIKGGNIIIIENVPEPIVFTDSHISKTKNNNKIKIGYFGVLEEKHRGLEDIISTVTQQNHIELHIIGYGPLDEILTKNLIKNIYFYGAKSSEEGLLIMSEMDIILGLYYKTIPNHFYAAPNKYFEHLMLGKAFLTTKDIPPGIKTTTLNTGWAINEGINSLTYFFDNILKPESIKIKSLNAKTVWEKNYKYYYQNTYINIYCNLIKKLNNQQNNSEYK
jgi:hypothetical protein